MPIIGWFIIGALLTGLGGGVVYTYNHAITRAETAEHNVEVERGNVKALGASLTDQLVENAKLVEQGKAKDEIIKRRGTANVTAAQIEGVINAKLSQLVASSPEVKAWSVVRVPDAVLSLVREPAKPAGSANASANAGGAAVAVGARDAGASVAPVDDQRRAFRLRQTQPITPATVQR